MSDQALGTKWFPLSAAEVLQLTGYAGIVYTIADGLLPNRKVITSLVAVAAFVLALMFWAIARLWGHQGSRFAIRESKKAGVSYSTIARASHTILVTHFSSEVPAVKYIEKMKEKLDQGVNVVRFLPDLRERPKWLSNFDEKRGNGYDEKLVPWLLPFDVLIVDGEETILLFPSDSYNSQYTRGVVFASPEIARMFEVALARLDGVKSPSSIRRLSAIESLNDVKEKLLTAKALYNTAFSTGPSVDRDEYQSWLKSIVECHARGCIVHEVMLSRERLRKLQVLRTEKHNHPKGAYHGSILPTQLPQNFPFVDFLVVVDSDGARELIFGWTASVHSGLHGDCFSVKDPRVIDYFLGHFADLQRLGDRVTLSTHPSRP